jgi:hypothetical protein
MSSDREVNRSRAIVLLMTSATATTVMLVSVTAMTVVRNGNDVRQRNRMLLRNSPGRHQRPGGLSAGAVSTWFGRRTWMRSESGSARRLRGRGRRID